MKKINFNKILYIFMILLVIIFMMFLYKANILPLKYFICVFVVMLLWLVMLYFLLIFKTQLGKNKKRKITGYLFSAFLVILMALIFYYLSVTLGFFKGFGNNKYMEENYLVLVLNDSDYNEINDLENKSIGYIYNELTNVDEAIKKMGEKLVFSNTKYDKYDNLFDDLVDKNIDAVLIEESSLNIIDEEKQYDNLFKTIYKLNLTFQIEEMFKEIDVTKDSFTIFISGIDSYGKINTTSRSDVNMVATVNPITKQILLISIPRDYYVRLSGTTGYKDKLTHAGIYGIDTSVKTVEELLNADINYYFRVNFSSVEKIVDAIGGVDVYSKYAFTTDDNYHFYQGYNHVNGKQALSFSRERHHLPYGDISRNENQRALIDALIRKATSGAIITKYSSILNSLADAFQTNMQDVDIQKIIKMQLNDMAKWNITSYGLTGTDGSEYTYSYQDGKLYVMHPNEDSLNKVIDLIDKVINGETLESSYDKDASNVKDPTYIKPSKPETKPDEDDNQEDNVINNPNDNESDNPDEEINSDEENNEDISDENVGDEELDNDINSDDQEINPLEPPLQDIIGVGDNIIDENINEEIQE